MWWRRSTRTSGSRAEAGYALTEVIVALVLGSSMAIAAMSGYVFLTRSWDDEGQRLATQQNLRMAATLLSREIRLAGACLPGSGPSAIRPMTGTDNGTTDTLTIRANVRCAIGTLTNNLSAGATSITLDTVTNFAAGMQAYVLHANTTTGEFVTIASVDTAPRRLNLAAAITQSYPTGSSVYGAEAQTFAVDASGSTPALTVTALGGSPQPAVTGVEQLNIRYVLDRNCTPGPCDIVDLPANDSEWSLVRSIKLDVGLRSARQVRSGGGTDGFYRLGQLLDVKPRNFVF